MSEYYGGEYFYDDQSKTLEFNRYCGLFSNVSVMMHLLSELKLNNKYPKKIHTNLTEYKGINLYDFLYDVDNSRLDYWKNYDMDVTRQFRIGTAVNLYGFGTSRHQINLDFTSTMLDTYFNPSNVAKTRAEEIIKKYEIDLKDSTFVWWRKTDKTREINWYRQDARYPSIDDVLKLTSDDKVVYFQTDDIEIYKEVSKYKNVRLLNVLPIDKNNTTGFHILAKSVNIEEFSKTYNQTFEEYLINLLAMTIVASRCRKFVGYPGNISLYVSLLRRNFHNVFFFKNHEEFY
jgi:hypothetical protein